MSRACRSNHQGTSSDVAACGFRHIWDGLSTGRNRVRAHGIQHRPTACARGAGSGARFPKGWLGGLLAKPDLHRAADLMDRGDLALADSGTGGDLVQELGRRRWKFRDNEIVSLGYELVAHFSEQNFLP